MKTPEPPLGDITAAQWSSFVHAVSQFLSFFTVGEWDARANFCTWVLLRVW